MVLDLILAIHIKILFPAKTAALFLHHKKESYPPAEVVVAYLLQKYLLQKWDFTYWERLRFWVLQLHDEWTNILFFFAHHVT